MLGANWWMYNNRPIKHIVYGIDLRYTMSSQVAFHQQFKTFALENNRAITESHCGSHYRVSTICDATAQLDYYGSV